MSITDESTLIAAIAAGERIGFLKTSVISQTAGRYVTLFRTAGRPGTASNPGTGVGNTCDSSTTGALPYTNPGSGNAYLASWQITSTLSAGVELYDRLVETSGLDGTVTTAQTVNSTALPSRATGGAGVELWLECTTDLGGTLSATVTASYTNQSGTASRTATLIGGIPATMRAQQMIPFALQAGDTGVQSVQTVTSTTNTTVAGSFGITLLRRYGSIQTIANQTVTQGWGETSLPIIPASSCLALLWMNSSTSTGVISGQLSIAKG